MWAIVTEPTNCIKQDALAPLQKPNRIAVLPDFRLPLVCGQTFSQPGNPSQRTHVCDKDLTPLAGTCANILRVCGDYMARQSGRGALRPWVLIRKARPKNPFSVSAGGCSRTFFVTLLSFTFFAAAIASAQDSDIDNIHVSPRIETTKINPTKIEVTKADQKGLIETESLRTRIPLVKSKVDLVLVPVTVTDPMNRLVTGLDRENFQVFEGKEEQEVRHFSAEDAPISLGVIFDMSGSMSSKIERAREAVGEFFKTANPQDEFFLVTFSDKPEEISDFTQSVDDLQGKLVFTVPKGRTALLDAIYLGVSKMRQAKYPKKALLIISDGGDNHSRYTEGEIKSTVKEADVMIYSIGIYDHYFQTEEERLGPALLSDVSELSGGRSFTIDNPNDLADVATKIGIELRNQYVLGYRPKNPGHDGKWHKIKVKLQPPKGLPPLHVYARTGYYASSQ
jgi:Ca-activated chloride channel homolog